MRALILALFLVGCARYYPAPQPPQIAAPTIDASKTSEQLAKERQTTGVADPAPPPPPRNFVCESFAAVNPKALCAPERSEPHPTHTARVTIDQQIIRCAINDSTPSVVCSPLIWIPPPPQEEKAPAKRKKR